MALTQLNITNLRNLISVELEPLPTGFNLIYGNNGGGKTSLLEAIHFLSLARSFRSSLPDRIINKEAAGFAVFAQILADHQQFIPVGIERHKDKSSKIRLAGQDLQSIAEVTRLLPIRLINAQNYNLLDGGPIFRRKYLDWGVFYLKNDFLSLWHRLDKALKQRNAALRSRLPKQEVAIWTRELIEASIPFNQARQEYIQYLAPLLLNMLPELLMIDVDIEIDYQRGWSPHFDYEEVLADSYLRDSFLTYTQFGPHKADLKIQINRTPAKDFLSRGQQKLFVCAMILAQGILLQKLTQKQPIYLIDDLPSELDNNSLKRLIELLKQQETQVFITAIEPSTIKEFVNDSAKMFHVEQGKIHTQVT